MYRIAGAPIWVVFWISLTRFTCKMRSFTVCTSPTSNISVTNQKLWFGRSMWLSWGRREIPSGFWWGILREKTSGRPKLKQNDNIKVVLNEIGFKDLGWIHRTQDRETWFFLWTPLWLFEFHKMQISWLAKKLLDSQRCASCSKLIIYLFVCLVSCLLFVWLVCWSVG